MGREAPPAIQDYYPDEVAHCYGCGFRNPHGLHLKTRFEGDDAVARFQPQPYHTAIVGFVYGGLLASLIDCHAMGTAAAATERAAGHAIGARPAPRFVTAALRVDYLRPTPLGPALELRGRARELGGRKVVVDVTVSVAGTITVRGEVVAVRMPETMARPDPD